MESEWVFFLIFLYFVVSGLYVRVVVRSSPKLVVGMLRHEVFGLGRGVRCIAVREGALMLLLWVVMVPLLCAAGLILLLSV